MHPWVTHEANGPIHTSPHSDDVDVLGSRGDVQPESVGVGL